MEREKIDEYLHKVLSGLILDAINGVESSRFVSEEDRKFIADYYTFAFSGLLEQWISSGMPDTREKMVSNIITIAQGSIKSSLEKFEDRESV